MELAKMTIDELRSLKEKIEQELKVRETLCELTVEMNSNDRFIIKHLNIKDKCDKVKDIFLRYGTGIIFSSAEDNDKITFGFDDDRDANDCQNDLDRVVTSLRELCR